jgi:hypothetical protein
MAPRPDPIATLQRVAASYGAGKSPNADLVSELWGWIGPAAVPILNGEPADAALGLKARQGAWQRTPVNRARFDRRDAALRELWPLTEGCDAARVRQIHDWHLAHEAFNHCPLTPAQAREFAACIPRAAWAPLDGIADSGLPVPESRALLRVVRPVSHGTNDGGQACSVESEAPPVAAHGHRP